MLKNKKLLIGGGIIVLGLLCIICSIGAALSTTVVAPTLQASMTPVTIDYTADYNQIISSSGAIISELDKGYDANPNTMTRHFATIIDSYETLIEIDAPEHIITTVTPCANTITSILEGEFGQSEALRYYTVLSECASLQRL